MTAGNETPRLGWLGIVRLGLVQTSLGAIVVLMTSTLNRVMVVELALPAVVPGLLVGLHYGVQVLRPRWGYGSDVGGRRAPWIIGGMAALAAGATGAAAATALASLWPLTGIVLALLAFLVIGVGVGAAGTSVLALLAAGVEPRLRGPAAATVWIMMIAGFAVTAPLAGHYLDPFTPARLVAVTAVVAGAAFLVASLAVLGLEPRRQPAATLPGRTSTGGAAAGPGFLAALRDVWSDRRARRFAIFVFVSMLAYSAQDLVLEPFSGVMFGFTPGQSTSLSGVQHGGVLAGMIAVSLIGAVGRGRLGSLRVWTVLGCAASALPLAALAGAGFVGPEFPLRPVVFALGLCNGIFAVAAIGSMMGLAHGRDAGGGAREGTRMGVWGAAQAVAFGLGGFGGTMAVDVARHVVDAPATAYAIVFLAEALLFVASAVLAASLEAAPAAAAARPSGPLAWPRSEGLA